MAWIIGSGITATTGESLDGKYCHLDSLAINHSSHLAHVAGSVYMSKAARVAGASAELMWEADFDDSGSSSVLGFTATLGPLPSTNQATNYDNVVRAIYDALPTHPATSALLAGAVAG